MSDIADIIDDFAVGFTVNRRGAGTSANGRYTPAAPTAIPATGTVTPATGRDLLRLPEARRTEHTKRIITKTAIQLLPQADIITYLGKDYEAASVAPWDVNTSFFDCLAVEVHA